MIDFFIYHFALDVVGSHERNLLYHHIGSWYSDLPEITS